MVVAAVSLERLLRDGVPTASAHNFVIPRTDVVSRAGE
jgi:hypothetical protein